MSQKKTTAGTGAPTPVEVRRMLETQSQELIVQQKQLIAAFDQLEILSEKLRLADQMKDEFVSMVVHELRNPLASVLQGIECARDMSGSALPPKTAHYLDVAKRNVARLNRIMGDLLDLAKLEAGRLDVDLDCVDPAAVLQDARLSFLAEAERAQVSIALGEAEGEVPPVLADPSRLEQVLGNLISNAIKFTPAGGAITLQAARAEREVLFSVADTGQGIAPEFHETIFEKYRQLKAHEGGGKRGTGLGLPICRHLVELHDGSIGVESEAGKGARFFFTIPLYTIEGRVRKLMPLLDDYPPAAAWRIDLAQGEAGWRLAHPVVRGWLAEREWAVVDPGRERIWVLSARPDITGPRLERMAAEGHLKGTLAAAEVPPVLDAAALVGMIDRG